MSLKKAPRTGIRERNGTLKRGAAPSQILFEASPVSRSFRSPVRKVVSDIARMLMTTPLIT